MTLLGGLVMKSSKLLEIIKKGSFVVPYYLFQLRSELSATLEEFIFLVYLMNLGNKIVFDTEKMANDLNISIEEIMNMIDSLSQKKYLSVEVIKNDKGIMEEYVVLDLFYDKISMILMEEMNQVNETDKTNIYEKIEKEFGRPITAIEYEIIKSWLENGTSEELISEALKEAVYNGVTNLRYIDKILYEWTKKGIETKEDVEKNRVQHREEKKESSKLELFDYDWFDDDEE